MVLDMLAVINWRK